MSSRGETVDDRVVVVGTDGSGSLAAYSRWLARSVSARTEVVRGCSGTFGHGLFSPYALRSAAYDLDVVRRLRTLGRPLIHFTSQHLARYGPWAGVPYVVTVHDLMRYRDCRRRDGGPPLIHEPNLRDRLLLGRDAAGLRGARRLIAVSEHTKRELVDLLGVPDGRVAVVPEGVDREAFHPVSRRLLADPYLLYVGSEQPRKNLATLFRAFMRVRSECDVPELKLVKVGAPGGAEAPFRRATVAHADAAGARPHVVFADRVSHADLMAWYSGALCLVLPSRHEGFGFPPLEAMACGCPAVVSDAGALPEVVGEAGVVYGAPDDELALAEALRRLLERPAERERLARAGLARAATMSWERTADLTRAVWREALSLPVARRPEPAAAEGIAA